MRRYRVERPDAQTGIAIDMGSSKYSQATAARTAILNKYTGASAITINDGGFIDEVVTTTASANADFEYGADWHSCGAATSTGLTL